MTQRDLWRCSESRPIPPFRTSGSALREVAFKYLDDSEYSQADPYQVTLEPQQLQAPSFRPSFRLKVDPDALASESGLPPDRLGVALVLKDPALLTTHTLARWPATKIPEQFDVPENVLQSTSGNRGLEFAVYVTPTSAGSPQFRVANRPGQLVAARYFSIDVPDDGVGFPITTVDSAVFEGLNLPKETVWIIDWRSTGDFDRPVDEILRVLLNSDYAKKLLRLPASESLPSIIWTSFAIEVYLEMTLVILSSEPPEPTNKQGLLAKLLARLQTVTGLSQDALIAKAKSGEDGMRFFRAHLQKSFALNERLLAISLQGRVR
jgi:hypothetical protein